MKALTRIVTPGFVAFQAHCWFAYAVVFTFPYTPVAVGAFLVAAFKEFYIDKHYEDNQTFLDDLEDFAGYCAGISLAVMARTYGL